MLKKYLEQLFELIAQDIPSEQIMQAKNHYQKMAGEIYEDDKSYNTRMCLFLEWYLLDYYKKGVSNNILESITNDNQSEWIQSHKQVCHDICNNIQALFEVKKVRDNSVVVLDLFRDKKYQIDVEDSKLIFRKHSIFQARIVSHQGKLHFTGYYCFHPAKSHPYVKDEAKKIFLLQRSWDKELTSLEKELVKKEKINLKNLKHIEKIKTKIERTGFDIVKDKLANELIKLEAKKKQFDINTDETNQRITVLINEKMKIEGGKLVSELINKLAYMNLRWERSRQIEILDIYKN